MYLSIEHVKKTYGDRQILNDITLYLNAGDRVGVVGVNGCGKSTLLRIAAFAEETDAGSVSKEPNIRIGYLTQVLMDDPENTVLEQVYANGDDSARRPDEYEAIEILNRLGISDPKRQIKELSGGQRKRVALAACLAYPSDVLVLDEPTNHLDVDMICWLEDYLASYNGAVLMVTHDRYFLEHVATKTAEITFGKLYVYDGGYAAYLDGRARRVEMLSASERKRQSTLRRELAWVLQGPCARGTKSRERLERYQALKEKQPPEFEKQIEEIRTVSSRLGRKTIELNDVSVKYGEQYAVKDFSFLLHREDRIGIVGPNGAGKTTLLNLIAGRLKPDTGTVSVGETVKIGYFTQHAEELDEKETAIMYVKEQGDRIETADGVLTAAKLMEQFLFEGPLQHRQIGKLSGGERRRLFLLGILASAPNVLLLDEPTNDLDIPTLTVLENYLETFPGAVIAVSHDRYFLDRICKRILIADGSGGVAEYGGAYTDYREMIQAQNRPVQKRAGEKDKTDRKAMSGQVKQKLRFSYKEQREYETIECEIAEMEGLLSEVKRKQEANADNYILLQQLAAEQADMETALEDKMDRWLYLNELAERIRKQNGNG